MISYSNRQSFDDIAFAEYLKKPGYSQSFLKREINGVAPGVEVTDNMRLGSMVDQILTEPHKVDMTNDMYIPASEIAKLLKSQYGNYIDYFSKQKNFIADIEYLEHVMTSKGRLDFLLPRIAVTDLKVTASSLKDVPTLVRYMGYDNQLWHYSRLSQVDNAYLMVYSRKDKKANIFKIPVDNPVNEFWAEKILKFGSLKHII